MRSVSGPDSAIRLGDGPLVFSGRPPLITGELELRNPSDERVKVRALAMAGAAGTKAGPAKGAGPAFGPLKLAARLDPGSSSRVRAHLRVDRFTPPGRYDTRVEVGGQALDAVVHVFERDSVRAQPRPVRLRGLAGETVSQPMVVTNQGNVSHALPDAGQVFVGEKDWFGRSLVYALREVSEEDGHEQYLDRLLQEFRATLPAPARLKVEADVTELAPGATAEVRLEVVLPEGLVKGRSYVGRSRFMGAGIGFEIDCIGTAKTVKRRPR